MKETYIYQLPLQERFASHDMLHLFSPDKKFSTWRKLWLVLAKSEKKLGINITNEQIKELEAYIEDINYDVATEREKVCRHDVMAHVYAYGVQCPNAAGIIHLGATSCYVTDNTDIILIQEALNLVKRRVIGVVKLLTDFAAKNKSVVTLGYTHYQPAQLTTVGKRATLWIQEFVDNLAELDYIIDNLKLLGCKGTTGTQESFMKLFDSDEEKIKNLDHSIASEFGFSGVYPVSGQTYPRSLDTKVLDVLSHVAISCYKFANDMRLLQHDKELEEPFEKSQIGSSAMAYKRNPMRSERICSLSRYIANEAKNATDTAMVQWLERTLDDSANKRLCVPETFLSTDAVLILVGNVADGIVVNKAVIAKRVAEELPFMATEEILMHCVRQGANRQKLHEQIRIHSMEAGKKVKEEGKANDLLERIANDPEFDMTYGELEKILNPLNLCGRSVHQVEEYLSNCVYPILEKYSNLLDEIDTTVNV
jgi:adenylosuccinate lyase